MPRRISDRALQFVADLVAAHPEGISRADLQTAYEARRQERIGSRTLQRWLARLIEDHLVESIGEGPAIRYRSVERTPVHPGGVEQEEGYVHVSLEGARVRRVVQRPLADRVPVGYNQAFLRDYIPGETWYLDHAHRNRLHELGRTPLEEQPAGTYAREMLDRLLIDLSWASSRLEGNTYSLLDTKNLIEYGQRAEGKEAAEAQMILNHKHAIELLVDQAEEVGFNLYTFITDPFEQAFFVMVQLPLIKYNLCPLSFIDVPKQAYIEGLLGVYEMNRVALLRDVFLWAYERSSQRYKVIRESLGEPDPFRLRYRQAIEDVLGTIIRSVVPPRESTVREAARDLVPAADLEPFVEMAFSELLNLHEGSIARYRLRPSEFNAWRDRWKAS